MYFVSDQRKRTERLARCERALSETQLHYECMRCNWNCFPPSQRASADLTLRSDRVSRGKDRRNFIQTPTLELKLTGEFRTLFLLKNVEIFFIYIWVMRPRTKRSAGRRAKTIFPSELFHRLRINLPRKTFTRGSRIKNPGRRGEDWKKCCCTSASDWLTGSPAAARQWVIGLTCAATGCSCLHWWEQLATWLTAGTQQSVSLCLYWSFEWQQLHFYPNAKEF